MRKNSMTISKRISLVMLALILAILAVTSFGAISSKNTVEAKEAGATLKRAFRTSYYKGEKIYNGNSEVTTIPDLEGGKVTVTFLKGEKWVERTIDLVEAYENYKKANTDGLDFIIIYDFNTEQTFDSNETKKYCEMKIHIYPHDYDRGFELRIKYVVYLNAEDCNSAISAINILTKINTVLSDILTPIVIVVCSIGVVFAIFLGFKMAKSNNAEEREEAKKRVIFTIVAIAIGVLLIIMFQLFAASSIGWFGLSDSAEFFQL